MSVLAGLFNAEDSLFCKQFYELKLQGKICRPTLFLFLITSTQFYGFKYSYQTKKISKIDIWPIGGSLIVAATQCLNDPRNNDNEGLLQTSQVPKVDPQYWMQFNLIHNQ